MPLLPKETEIFPEDLFALPEQTWPWNVAHIRSRQEKTLARHLVQREVPFYLPQVMRRSRSGVRTRVSYLPLFSGYLFFRGSADARQAALRSGVVAGIIDVEDQRLLAEQLLQIRRLEEAGAAFEPYEEIVPGDAVHITDGPFAGYTGVVVRQGRAQRLIIELSLLHKCAAVEFAPEVLKRARA